MKRESYSFILQKLEGVIFMQESELLDKYKPPTHFKKIGKDTWIRIWTVLEEEEKADQNDPIAVEMIAYNYQLYNDMVRTIKRDGLTINHTNKAKETNKLKHPLLSELPKTMDQLRKYLGELGLTGASRKRLQENLKGSDDDFDDF
jgi:P27 family predicted phage terminase small subunit